MNDEHELYAIARSIRYDLTAAQAKISELLRALGELNLPTTTDKPTCPVCGIELPGPRKLAEHLYVIHDGPVPEHWDEAEAKADL